MARPPRPLVGPARFPRFKALRTDLNERVAYLDRRGLLGIYGRTAVRNALRNARSIRRLDPTLREMLELNRHRILANHRCEALSRRLRALEIKGAQHPPDEVSRTTAARFSAELTHHQAELKLTHARMAVLSGDIARHREVLRQSGLDLTGEEDDFLHHQVTWGDLLKKRALRREPQLQRLLETTALTALEGAPLRAQPSLREELRPLLREALEPLVLAVADGGDPVAFCQGVVDRAARALAGVLGGGSFRVPDPAAALQLFEELLKCAAYPAYQGEVVVAYGGSSDPLNVRLPTYLLPAISVLRAFEAAGLPPPRLRVLNAASVAIALNGLDGERVAATAGATQALLSGFVRRFFPRFEAQLTVTVPGPSEFLEDPVFPLALQRLREFVRQYPDNRAVRSLLRKGERHSQGGEEGALEETVLRYLACHLVGCAFGDVRQHRPGGLQPEFVIKVGGDGENDFNFFQAYLANLEDFAPEPSRAFFRPNTSGLAKRAFPVTPIQLNSVIGKTPPYYRASEDEVLIDRLGDFRFPEVLHYYRSDLRLRTVAADLEAVEKAGLEGEAYLDFLRQYARN